MSYDLRFCLPVEGRTREEIATSDDLVAAAPDSPAGEPRREGLAAALMAAMPGLVRTGMAGPGFDEHSDAPGGEGVADPPVLELSVLDDASGLQITIADREAGLSVPYGHGPDRAREALAVMWRCAEIVEREGGFFTYDQQAGRILDLTKDFELVLATYRRANDRVAPRAVERTPAGRSRLIFPRKLDRLPYLLHWLALSAAALGLIYGIVLLTQGTRAEPIIFVPMAAWFGVKILVIDPARIRAIGWAPTLTFLSLFPPAALFLQLLLFLLSSRSHESRG